LGPRSLAFVEVGDFLILLRLPTEDAIHKAVKGAIPGPTGCRDQRSFPVMVTPTVA
jgi:hypothetical protein